jgi:hypothetical protein
VHAVAACQQQLYLCKRLNMGCTKPFTSGTRTCHKTALARGRPSNSSGLRRQHDTLQRASQTPGHHKSPARQEATTLVHVPDDKQHCLRTPSASRRNLLLLVRILHMWEAGLMAHGLPIHDFDVYTVAEILTSSAIQLALPHTWQAPLSGFACIRQLACNLLHFNCSAVQRCC